MKKIILFTLLAFCLQVSVAQTRKDHRKNERKTERKKNDRRHTKDRKEGRYTSLQSGGKLHKTGYVLESEVNRYFDTTGKATDNDKTEFKFDAKGWLTEETFKTWDEGASQTEVSKIEYTRDGMGRSTTILTWVWDDVKKIWIKDSKEVLTHNNDSAAARITVIYNVVDNSKEVPLSKIDYGYDINHNLITDTYYEYDTTKKVYDLIDQYTYTYDASGNRITDTYSTWNAVTKKYDAIDKYFNIYDTKNNRMRSILMDWVTNKFLNSTRDTFAYDASNNMLINVYGEWDALKNKWTNVEKIENTYDSKNNQTLSKTFTWDARGSKWVDSYKIESAFDINFSTPDLILPYDKETIELYFKTKHLKNSEFSWNKTKSAWDSAATTTYNYTIQNIGIRDINTNADVSIYPNPANDKVYINVKNSTEKLDVNIYDIWGKLIQSDKLSDSGFINIEGLTQGIYMLQLSKGQTLLDNRKLVVE